MKRKEIEKKYREFDALNHLTGSSKYAFAIAKNLRKLGEELKKIHAKNTPAKEAMEFENERREAIQPFLEKDESGKNKVVDGQINLDKAKTKEWEKEFKKLEKKYSEAIKEEEKRQKEFFDVYLEEEVEIELHKIKESEYPKELTPAQANSLIDITL